MSELQKTFYALYSSTSRKVQVKQGGNPWRNYVKNVTKWADIPCLCDISPSIVARKPRD